MPHLFSGRLAPPASFRLHISDDKRSAPTLSLASCTIMKMYVHLYWSSASLLPLNYVLNNCLQCFCVQKRGISCVCTWGGLATLVALRVVLMTGHLLSTSASCQWKLYSELLGE